MVTGEGDEEGERDGNLEEEFFVDANDENLHDDNNSRGLKISTKGLCIGDLLANLDFDGDGKLSAEEYEIGKELKKMDKDGDGFVTLKELVSIGTTQIAEDNKKVLLKRLILVATVFMILACGAMLGVGVLAAEAAKDSKPDAAGELWTVDGKLLQMGVTARTYNASELVDMSMQALRKAREMLAVQADNTRNFYRVTGFDKMANGDLHLMTPSPDEKVIVFKQSKNVVVKKCITCAQLPVKLLTLTVEQGGVQ